MKSTMNMWFNREVAGFNPEVLSYRASDQETSPHERDLNEHARPKPASYLEDVDPAIDKNRIEAPFDRMRSGAGTGTPEIMSTA
jgi:hypothetical protein